MGQRIKTAIKRKAQENNNQARKDTPPVSSIQIAIGVQGEEEKKQGHNKEKLKQSKQEEVTVPKVTLKGENQHLQELATVEPDFQLKTNNASTWMGRVVALRVPSTVDPAFDEKWKPTGRQVDPSLFDNKRCGPYGWNPWEEGSDSQRSCLDDRDCNPLSFHRSDYDYYLGNDDKCEISINVHLFNTIGAPTIKLHLGREPTEDVSKTFQRLQISMQKKLKKKMTKKGKQASVGIAKPVLWRKRATEQPQNVEKDTSNFLEELADILPFNLCGPPFSHDMTIGDDEGDDEYERLEDLNFTIEDLLKRANRRNFGEYAISVPIQVTESETMHVPLIIDPCPPTITKVTTFGSFEHSRLFEETPLVVEVGLLYATRAKITWFADAQEVCHDNCCYTPTKSDVGKVITVVVTPLRAGHDGKGCEEAYQYKRPVEALPSMPILSSLRDDFLVHRDRLQEEKQIRVVSYNILADQNASRDVKRDDEDKMYSHCKLDDIVKWRRHPLIVHEIIKYQSDIVCLQEVDRDVFNCLLRPCLEAHGYQGYYSEKGVDDNSSVREGCAMFWSLDAFESVRLSDMKTFTFREMFQQFVCDERVHKSEWNSLKDVATLLTQHEHLQDVLFNKLGHVLQTVCLTEKRSKEKVLVGNTHLFYHPQASHVKCLKMLIACRQLEIESLENELSPLILCGDFNSTPDSGVMELLLNRFVDSGDKDTWEHLCTWEYEDGAGAGVGDLKHVESINLEYPTSFPKLITAYEKAPEFTHYSPLQKYYRDYFMSVKSVSPTHSSFLLSAERKSNSNSQEIFSVVICCPTIVYARDDESSSTCVVIAVLDKC
jgi:mRNA deadenylase 3'-5' endonuclease subunit Ccr4